MHRQFAIAQYLHQNISDEEKKRLLWDPSTGSFAGFKPGFGWKVSGFDFDLDLQFRFFSAAFGFILVTVDFSTWSGWEGVLDQLMDESSGF